MKSNTAFFLLIVSHCKQQAVYPGPSKVVGPALSSVFQKGIYILVSSSNQVKISVENNVPPAFNRYPLHAEDIM